MLIIHFAYTGSQIPCKVHPNVHENYSFLILNSIKKNILGMARSRLFFLLFIFSSFRRFPGAYIVSWRQTSLETDVYIHGERIFVKDGCLDNWSWSPS